MGIVSLCVVWQARAAAPATAAVGSESSGVLGSNERSVISKYGADDDAEEAGEENAGDADEED